MTIRRVIASSAAALALVTGISIASAGTASAASGGGCVYENKDGLTVRTCIDVDSSDGIWGEVQTSGSNNTSIDLCVETVDSNQNLVPGSRNCQVVNGSSSDLYTSNIAFPGPGTYYAVSYFTSPTYWYGGESPALYI